MNKSLLWLMEWYYDQCDSDWEHRNGIQIGTLDNPGWYMKVNLEGTAIQDKNFHIVDIARSENDWVYCSIENELFMGYGGPFNLPEITHIFRKWVTEEK